MDINQEKVKELFDGRAKLTGNNTVLSLNDNFETTRQNIYRDYITKKSLFKYLKIKKEDVVLDFGCGIGRLAKYTSKKAKKVYAVDISEKMIEKAILENNNSNIEYSVVDEQFNFSYNTLQKIYTCWVLQHISDSKITEYLQKFNKFMVDNAKIVILEQCRKNTEILCNLHIHRSKEHYIKLFEDAGFKLVENKNVFRVPSYSMHLWKKANFPKIMLPLFGLIERLTVNIKTEFVEYINTVMIFQKV